MIKDIKTAIEKYLNLGESVNFDDYSLDDKINIKRITNRWCLFKSNEKYKIDFEITLRDFLIQYNISLNINDYIISEFGQKILNLYKVDNEIYTNINYPNYINKNFIKNCYVDSEIKNSNSCILRTNGFIKKLTNYSNFKSEEQKVSVLSALKSPFGSTTLISMSTGGGKSLITQTLAYQYPGLTIVIVPTISLMIDQTKNAREIIKPKDENEILYYNSSSNVDEIVSLLNENKIRILFISPEALIKNGLLRATIEKLNKQSILKNLIIDEAHIAVEWGSYFRTDFQCLSGLKNYLLSQNSKLRTYLLSATFSDSTVSILKKSFSSNRKWIEIRCDSLRKEQQYCIKYEKNQREKNITAIESIVKLPHPIIVYVQSPEDANELKRQLEDININNTYVFSGLTTNSERDSIISSWENDEFDIMIATCAFGVGVDKRNVRTVLHLYIPENPNKFYQEAGRAGRDGRKCLSVLLYTDIDFDRSFSFIPKVLTEEKIVGRWLSMYESILSKKLGEHKIDIDTSVRPEYLIDDDIEIGNNRDINWNVYVILFLQRNDLLNIIDVRYDNQKYIIKVELTNNLLMLDKNIIKNKIKKLRDSEWDRMLYEFELMKRMIKNCKNQCVSETFCELYGLVDQFCSGCDNHTCIKDYAQYDTILKKEISNNTNLKINKKILGKFDKYEIRYDNLDKCVEFIMNDIDSIIISDENISFKVSLDDNIDVFSLVELKKLYRKALLLFGNVVCFVFDDNEKNAKLMLELSDYLYQNFRIKIIYMIKNDIYLKDYNKQLVDLIECPYIYEYQIGGNDNV